MKGVAAIGTLSLVIARSFLGAFVLLKFWEWFIMSPLGAPKITYPQAYGLDMCIGLIMLTGLTQATAKSDEEDEDGLKAFRWALVKACVYAIILELGFVVHLVIKG